LLQCQCDKDQASERQKDVGMTQHLDLLDPQCAFAIKNALLLLKGTVRVIHVYETLLFPNIPSCLNSHDAKRTEATDMSNLAKDVNPEHKLCQFSPHSIASW
jgi:hypothetical protein